MNIVKSKFKFDYKLILVLCGGFIFRLYGIDWDNWLQLHPDERMLMMVADGIRIFDKLNPNFFNYGSLPIYLLKAISQLINFFTAQYQISILMIARYLSLFFDLGTAIMLYLNCLYLFKEKRIALFACFFYIIAFFPIQSSHFFTVDTILTFFITLLIYLLLVFVSGTHHKNITLILIALTFSAMMATKISAIIFLPIIIWLLIFNSRPVVNLFYFGILFCIFFFIFMPYAILDYKTFLSSIELQLKMNSDPYIFPYTLQYVGTVPYLYYLKNIFLWGMGPLISVLSIIGFYKLIYILIKNYIPQLNYKTWNIKHETFLIMLYVTCYMFYFLVIGRSAVKFMRYMLPFYPFIAVLAAYGIFQVQKYLVKFKIFTHIILTGCIIWTLLFINIFSQTHTRISATDWIISNIPINSRIAVEHWDDKLPLTNIEKYQIIELPLYDQPDNDIKWTSINKKLEQSDYLIIASNRLFTPLSKLDNCQKYKYCYPKTAGYYKKLFNGQLGYKKVAEFKISPHLKIACPKLCRNGYWKLEIDDSTADESFTVYDHPQILIFKKFGQLKTPI